MTKGRICASAKVQMIPRQIRGYVPYIVSSPLMDMVRAHDMPRICHSLWWWHCIRLSSESLRGRLGEARHVFVCQDPIHNGSIIQNKRKPSKCLSLSLHRSQRSISELRRDGWSEFEIRNRELQDSLILDTMGCEVASIYWIVGSLKTSSGLCPCAVCRHIKSDFCFLNFCIIYLGYHMIYVSSSSHLHSGEVNSSEKLLGRVTSAGFSGWKSFTCLCELVKKQKKNVKEGNMDIPVPGEQLRL